MFSIEHTGLHLFIDVCYPLIIINNAIIIQHIVH